MTRRDITGLGGIRSDMSLAEVCAACAGALVMPIVLSLVIRRYRCPDGVRPPRLL
ncbi:MAG: hypothetical protein QM820_57305 [Minicystis sp.]